MNRPNPAHFQTLSQWRLEALKLPQHEIARRAKSRQARISAIENGHLPRPWNQEPILKAYELEGREADFQRMVRHAGELRAIGQPIDAEFPLARFAEGEGQIVDARPVRKVRFA